MRSKLKKICAIPRFFCRDYFQSQDFRIEFHLLKDFPYHVVEQANRA